MKCLHQRSNTFPTWECFVGLGESGHWGVPACEGQAEQASPLQNQIPFLAPWILPRGEVCEAQADLALHGNKVSLLSDTLIFAPFLPFYGLCMWLITAGVAFRGIVPVELQEKIYTIAFRSWIKLANLLFKSSNEPSLLKVNLMCRFYIQMSV